MSVSIPASISRARVTSIETSIWCRGNWGSNLEDHELRAILRYVTPQQVLAERAAIRQLLTDAERLLHAVGENALRTGLPDSLVAALEGRSTPPDRDQARRSGDSDLPHTSALKQYQWALDRLAPPARWAGSARAVEFVQSLGFSAEWAEAARRTPGALPGS